MNKVFFIIGACASGKTLAMEGVQKRLPRAFHYCYYDSLGTPSDEEVYSKYGSWDGWHRHLTHVWVKKIKEEYLDKKSVVIDGQSRPDFIEEACDKYGIDSYEVILLECSMEERKKRLLERATPHIINPTLEPWVRYLHDESVKRGYAIIDNTNLEPRETQNLLVDFMRKNSGKPARRSNRKKTTRFL